MFIYLFVYYVALMQALFLKRILIRKSHIFVLNSYFLKRGFYLGHILDYFNTFYNVKLTEIDVKTVYSRVTYIWVQLHET